MARLAARHACGPVRVAGIRAELLADPDRLRHGEVGRPGRPGVVDALGAGEAIIVEAWKLPRDAREALGIEPGARGLFVVEPDETVHPLTDPRTLLIETYRRQDRFREMAVWYYLIDRLERREPTVLHRNHVSGYGFDLPEDGEWLEFGADDVFRVAEEPPDAPTGPDVREALIAWFRPRVEAHDRQRGGATPFHEILAALESGGEVRLPRWYFEELVDDLEPGAGYQHYLLAPDGSVKREDAEAKPSSGWRPRW